MQRLALTRRRIAAAVGLAGLALALAGCSQGALPSNVSSSGPGASETTIASSPSLHR